MKPRLVMKRLSTVTAGDIMVGWQNWTYMGALYIVRGVEECIFRPGKLRLYYDLGRRVKNGHRDRYPDYYVLCVKEPQRFNVHDILSGNVTRSTYDRRS